MLIRIWWSIFQLFHVLEEGVAHHPNVEQQILDFGTKAKFVKQLWYQVYRAEAYHLYEHNLLDHGKELLREFPHGMKGYSQNSQERANGQNQSFVQVQCFKGGWTSYSQLEENTVSSDGVILRWFRSIEQYTPEERQKIGILGKRKKNSEVLEPLESGRQEQLLRQLIKPFVRADNCLIDWLKDVTPNEKKDSHHKKSYIVPLKLTKC